MQQQYSIAQICELEQSSNPYFRYVSEYKIISRTISEVLIEYTFVEENLTQKMSASRFVRVEKNRLFDDAIVQ